MGKNNKPILSVLVDEDKKEKFAELARRSKYSMAWLLNDCIDRMLAADSIHIYSDSIGVSVGVSPEPPSAISRTDIEDIARGSIEVFVQPINRSVEELRSELAEVSEFARNLQGEIVKVQKALNVGVVPPPHIEKVKVVARPDRLESNSIVVNDWDNVLSELVRTGMRSTGIAEKLTEMGYTNSKGGAVDRKLVERRLDRLPELKEIYRKAKPE
jgi:hypothetical protein